MKIMSKITVNVDIDTSKSLVKIEKELKALVDRTADEAVRKFVDERNLGKKIK